MEEAPAMVFLLSEAWCKSEFCEQELMWFVLQRTGADLSNADPAQFAKDIFQQPKAALRALRAGAFFVICDEYSKNSDILRTLTETNLAIPREQFFRPDHSCMEPESRDLDEAIRSFVTEERIADEYRNNRQEFIHTTMEMSISTLQFLCVTLSSPAFVDTIKHSMGNIQIISGLREAFKITWPASMVAFTNGLKIFLGQVWMFVDLQCALGSYTYYDKFNFMVSVPIFIVVMVFVIAAALVAAGRYADSEARTQLLSRVTTAVSFLVFLVYPMVSQCIFQGLICIQLAENEWWLAADLQACPSPPRTIVL